MNIFAVDPGLTNPAAAWWTDGALLKAERVKVPGAWKDLAILDRCDRIGEAVVNWFDRIRRPVFGTNVALTLIVEWPRWYPRKAADDKQIDPNDLAGLCGIAGSICGRLRERGWIMESKSPQPAEVWGNVPKATKGDPWASPRGRRLASRLKPTERAAVQSKHDALDAAGLALFEAGLWAQRRLYPGAI